MICSNCGYENNPDDALSCGLCGKVFRKEVRKEKDVKEIDKQPMSKAKKFYGEIVKKDVRDVPDIPGAHALHASCRLYEEIKETLESKGEERTERILNLFSLVMGFVIAIVIGIFLDHKFGLRKAFYSPGQGYSLWTCFIGAMGIFIGVLLSLLFEKFTKKRKV